MSVSIGENFQMMMSNKSCVSTLFLLAAMTYASMASRAQTTEPLVQSNNLAYLGTFKLPVQSGNGFTYGGSALAYNAANNSLFIVGFVLDNLTAEVQIPALGGTATLLQPLTESLNGQLGSVQSTSACAAGGSNSPIRIGGNLVYNSQLYVSAFLYYDATACQTVSHFSRLPNLSSGTVTGPYAVGSSLDEGFYSGYMGLIPAEWQSIFGAPALTGNCCLSIISRTSYGPSVSAFNPSSTGPTAQPLVYYTQANQTLGQYGASGSHPVFNGTTKITSVIFPAGTSSVLFIGTTGIGPYCYGLASDCGDPSNNAKGDHAYPYRAYVWAYNANDLAAVKAGTKQPWSVVPYSTWILSELGDVDTDFGVGGAAYDPATKKIYISKKFGDTDGVSPLIYVYQLNNSTATHVPNPPTNLIAK